MDEQDRQALWIASQHRDYNILIDHQIRAAGMTPAEWFRCLDRLTWCPIAEAHDPVTVRRLRDAESRRR